MSMEAPEYSIGGKCRAGNSQITPEKQSKDQFIVEELLDFSNEEEDENGVGAGDEGGSDAAAGNLTDSSTVTAVDSCNSSFSGGDHLSLADAGDLCEPYDELADLEWLSNFVEESFSSEDLRKLQLISGVQSSTSSSKAARDPIQSPLPAEAATFFLPEPTAVPGKARSKRSRAATCNWSSRLLVLSPSNTPATSSSSDSSGVPDLLKPNTTLMIKKSHKTAKKKESGGGSGMVGAALAPTEGRRCLHCATDKTPQWRTGPMGPKTLCNACGVRYKSGRLVPEYRPASSPTFMLSKHSNSHRKVLELRRHKEVELPQQPFGHVGRGALYDGGSAAAGEEFLIHHNIGPDFRQLI